VGVPDTGGGGGDEGEAAGPEALSEAVEDGEAGARFATRELDALQRGFCGVHVYDERVGEGAALGLEYASYGGGKESVGAETVDCFGGEGYY